jgi:hypothetical protein
MRRADLNPRLGFRVDPSAKDAAARKHQSVRAVLVNDGQFEITIERRRGDFFPHVTLDAPERQIAL